MALASLFLFALADVIPYKKPCNCVLQIHLLAYTSLFSIKFDALILIYSQESLAFEQTIVSRHVFLSIVRVHGLVVTGDLSLVCNYADMYLR